MNRRLAIKGHSTRGREVIQILEMLGGNNYGGFIGNTSGFYFIDFNNNINLENNQSRTEFITFSLEEFLEKYPYKVGDKVKSARVNDFIGRITNVRWDDNEKQIIYVVELDDVNKSTLTYFATGLQPYKEEICTYYANDDDSKTDITIDGERLIAPNGYTIGNATRNDNRLIVEYIKNEPQYPKTYTECSQIINKVAKTTNELNIAYKPDLIYDFQKLLICRDAYWKIAGKEMGLSKPWKQDYDDRCFIIANNSGNIHTYEYHGSDNIILAFPTAEMRDAFFENFKDLIEECKKLL
jgi:hypothetical protein